MINIKISQDRKLKVGVFLFIYLGSTLQYVIAKLLRVLFRDGTIV